MISMNKYNISLNRTSSNDTITQGAYFQISQKFRENDTMDDSIEIFLDRKADIDSYILEGLETGYLQILLQNINDQSIYKIEIEDITNIEEHFDTKLHPQYISKYKLHGVVIRAKNISINAVKPSELVAVDFIISHLCNMRCDYCNDWEDPDVLFPEESLDRDMNVIVNDFMKFKPADITLLGGEVTADMKRYNKAMEIIRTHPDYDCVKVVKTFTNAKIYSQRLVDSILADDKGELLISVDTLVPEHDARHVNVEQFIKIVKRYVDALGTNRVAMAFVISEVSVYDLYYSMKKLYDEAGIRNYKFKTENTLSEKLGMYKYDEHPFYAEYDNQVARMLTEHPEIKLFESTSTPSEMGLSRMFKASTVLDNYEGMANYSSVADIMIFAKDGDLGRFAKGIEDRMKFHKVSYPIYRFEKHRIADL